MTVRKASHAGSWYTGNSSILSQELDGWLSQVDTTIDGIRQISQPGARVIIAPYDHPPLAGVIQG